MSKSCCANQLAGFYMRATLALNGLMSKHIESCKNEDGYLDFYRLIYFYTHSQQLAFYQLQSVMLLL